MILLIYYKVIIHSKTAAKSAEAETMGHVTEIRPRILIEITNTGVKSFVRHRKMTKTHPMFADFMCDASIANKTTSCQFY